jgi:DNA repair photolyase
LREAGIRAGVICAPVLPRITDAPKQLEAVVRAAAAAKASHIYANPLFLKACSAAVFLPFLKEHFPQLAPEYEKRFKDKAFLPSAYRKRISELFGKLRTKYGIVRESRWEEEPVQRKEEQLRLF